MVESTLITFKHAATKEAGTWDGWVDRLNTFLTRKQHLILLECKKIKLSFWMLFCNATWEEF